MIPLSPDPDDMPRHMPPEHCCFCAKPTRMWYAPRDVAVCTSCAEIRDESEVPTKDEWCESPQAFGYVPHAGEIVLDCTRAQHRVTLLRRDDGTYQACRDDFEEGAPMDERGAIAWLSSLVLESSTPAPTAREAYGKQYPWLSRPVGLRKA